MARFFHRSKAMSKSKQPAHLLVCVFLWALASKAIHSDTVSLRLSSPAGGVEFKAGGGQP